MSEIFAASHNFEITPAPDSVLGGPFGESRHPVGLTQAKIAIGNASATIQAKVVKNLPPHLMWITQRRSRNGHTKAKRQGTHILFVSVMYRSNEDITRNMFLRPRTNLREGQLLLQTNLTVLQRA
ncbi:uncharacterized protein LOC120849249 [Ixodes scapularis]|uniref:uncharacterized protein LOC120849249 n=1 Tax=Ixodes scapularis TaxID=6945 RepID=UPI001A9E137B|nr:uncharacterized protein LOC120849249 [Ixodes scapularis]